MKHAMSRGSPAQLGRNWHTDWVGVGLNIGKLLWAIRRQRQSKRGHPQQVLSHNWLSLRVHIANVMEVQLAAASYIVVTPLQELTKR